MVQKLDTLQESPSQTAGPYVHIGLMPTYAGNAGYYDEEIGTTPFIDESKAQGEIIEIVGSVYDGTGWAMRDALIESWQCDASGIFPGPRAPIRPLPAIAALPPMRKPVNSRCAP